jgi:hypothetical protein
MVHPRDARPSTSWLPSFTRLDRRGRLSLRGPGAVRTWAWRLCLHEGEEILAKILLAGCR